MLGTGRHSDARLQHDRTGSSYGPLLHPTFGTAQPPRGFPVHPRQTLFRPACAQANGQDLCPAGSARPAHCLATGRSDAQNRDRVQNSPQKPGANHCRWP